MSIPNIHLFFDFINGQGKKEPISFENPEKVIIATSTDQVLAALKEVEAAVNSGYYAAGYVSYEAAPAFDSAYKVYENPQTPLVWFGIFSKPTSTRNKAKNPYFVSEWKATTSYEEYEKAIHTIRQAIEEGDTYQVNYTLRLLAHFEGDSFRLFQKLAENQSANYSAYLDTGTYQILSASPELFFRLDNQILTTKPMKGTMIRGRSYEEDQEFASWLKQSEKNQAENLMIVDLLRNDLGKIAKPGTVKVPKLFEIETYPTVHQMTSTITADIESETSMVDIFTALFPCGSITGAPKISTMKYISQLETSPREVYCGAIGYITPEKQAVFNVPIRTVLIDQEKQLAQYGVGGGITWDSTSKDEYEEAQTKAKLLTVESPQFELLETIKLSNGSYFLLERHLQRMIESAHYFQFDYSEEKISEKLNEFLKRHENGDFRVRLILYKNGKIEIECQPYKKLDGLQKVKLATFPINENDPFFFHKTTKRDIYEQHSKGLPEDIFSVLLWNNENEITEFLIGNLVIEKEGRLLTPRKESGLLKGTLREELIELGRIEEATILKQDVQECEKMWLINSVRDWVPVTLV